MGSEGDNYIDRFPGEKDGAFDFMTRNIIDDGSYAGLEKPIRMSRGGMEQVPLAFRVEWSHVVPNEAEEKNHPLTPWDPL